MYGEQDVHPAPETHPVRLKPLWTRKIRRAVFRGFHRTYGFKYCAMRYGNVYCMKNPHKKLRHFNLCDRLIAGQNITVFDGRQTRDYVFVKDVVRANMLAIEKELNGALTWGPAGRDRCLNLAEFCEKTWPHICLRWGGGNGASPTRRTAAECY